MRDYCSGVLNQTGSTSYRDSALAFETTYEYKLRAVDGVGNESGDSDMASATTKAKTKTKGKGGGGGGCGRGKNKPAC